MSTGSITSAGWMDCGCTKNPSRRRRRISCATPVLVRVGFIPQAAQRSNEGTPAPAPIRRTGHRGRQTWGRSGSSRRTEIRVPRHRRVVVGTSEHNPPSVAPPARLFVLLQGWAPRCLCGTGARRACAAAVLRFDARRTGGSADRCLGTHQRHPRSQQLATSDAEPAGLPRGAGGRNPTTRSQLTRRLYVMYHLNVAWLLSHVHLAPGRKHWSWI